MNRLHRESGEERPEPGGAHIFLFVVARSFRGDGNLLQPTGGVNRTPSHVTFSRVSLHS